MNYNVLFSKQAEKDIKKLSPKLKEKVKEIIRNNISVNPYCGKPLIGDLKGYYSFRLTYKDRIVYSVDEEKVLIYILRAKTHYGE